MIIIHPEPTYIRNAIKYIDRSSGNKNAYVKHFNTILNDLQLKF